MEKSSGGRRKSTKPRDQQQVKATTSDTPGSDEDFTADVYVNHEGKRVVVSYALTRRKETPELEVSPEKCLFQRWRLRDQISNEKRYGRDDLRKRGFVVVERHHHDGKIVRIYSKPIVDDE